jgi:glycosyltransferase involved in cell wall biosynthesis
MQTVSTPPPLRMILVSDTVFDTNGVSRFIRDMAVHASRFKTEFTVITASPIRPDGLPGNIVNLRPFLAITMPFYKEQYLNLLPPFVQMFRQIRRLRPQVIHISTPGPLGWSALLIAKLLSIPTAATYHTDFAAFLQKNTGSKTVYALTSWVMRRFYRRMAFTFSRSKRYVDTLKTEVALPDDKIVFLRPGTDTEAFHPRHRRSDTFWEHYGITDSPLVILYVGRLNVEKNVLFLIERYRELRQHTSRATALVLVGEGAYSEHAQRWKADNIHALGVKRGRELSEIYAGSDLFVSASLTETLGQNIMEAHASGLPAIVTDRGGVTETVVDGETGHTLSVDAPQLWVTRMQALIEDDRLRERMGTAAFERMQGASIIRSCEAFLGKHKEVVR